VRTRIASTKRDRTRAELRHADFKGHPRAQRRLLEEHPERLAAQKRKLIGGPARFEVRGDAQDRPDLGGSQVGYLEHVPPLDPQVRG